MAKNDKPNFDQALAWFRDHGFDLLEAPGTKSRVFLKKYNVSAAVEKDDNDGVRLFARPGYLVGSEIARLVDRGYQKFLKTTKAEIPATADHLKALHQFSEEFHAATGIPTLYNESLGSVSDAYLYDRVEHRDQPPAQRPKRPWEDHAETGKRTA
ncbi:MAG TPA: hypothetical protein VFA60_07280 [Terriglobales bacterium]|nr:hypothetical protein [Terriglobales bacterium]